MTEEKTFKVSEQFAMAMLFALQNSLAEQTDIMPELMGWKLFIKDDEVWIENPPVLRVSSDASPYDEQPEEVKKVMDSILVDFEG